MIWTIVSKAEMEGYAIPPVFQYYREVVGRENIRLTIVDEDDPLDFVEEKDIVLLRTASRSLIETIEGKGVATTAEHYSVYQKASDKAELARLLGSDTLTQAALSNARELRRQALDQKKDK